MITFLLFVGFIFLLFWISSISNRVTAMEKRMQVTGATSAPVKAPVAVKLPEAQSVASWKPGSIENWQAIASQSSHNTLPASDNKLSQTQVQASTKNKDADDTEKAVNWLNRIGVVALVLGLGFFLKIAIDLGWIGPWAQVIIGLAIGGLLIYLGQLWKERFGTRAQALTGGGVAILYFSIYAAFNFYSLVPQFVAFVFMLAVAGYAVWLSYKNSSLVLGVLAFFGAYGSPLMFSSGQDQQMIMFGFLTLLNVTALVLMVGKYWMELLILTMFGTIIDFLVWGVNHSSYENTLTSLAFVIITTLLFVIGSAALFRFHSEKKTLSPDFGNGVAALQIISGTFFFASIVALLFDKFHSILPAVALLGAVVYFFSYALVDRLNYKNLNYCMSFCGAVLLSMAAVWQFDGKALSAMLLLIALLGATVGTLVKREELRVWGTIILFISLVKSLYDPYTVGDATFLFNAKFGLMFANTLALLFVGWLYQKVQVSEFEKNAEKVLQIAAALVLWGSVSWDISYSLTGSAQNYMTLWWVIYPVALSATGFMSRRSDLSKTALLLMAAGFFKVLFLPYTGGYTFLYNVKFGLMALETAGLLAIARFYREDEENKSFADALKVAACMLLWFAVSWDITKYFENDISKNSRNLFLSLWWITYSAILIGAGIAWRSALLRKIAIGLFFVTIAKVFLFDLLSLDLGYLIVSFISLGVILISVSFYYNKHKEQITKFLEGEEKINKIIN
ncbi:MAG: DUF2339 domain-containing protein [Candidatus Doudnabacteria bacterium]|jgi:uncharacterized membrane protein